MATACGVAYHCECIRVGPPFHSRLGLGRSLGFPSVEIWPNFVCEVCTVRAVLDRELRRGPDTVLLQLERMRMVDTANSWARGTLTQYQTKLRQITRFEEAFDLTVLRPSHLRRPPSGPEIPLLWSQEWYSSQGGGRQVGEGGEKTSLAFGTIRQLRSAASHFLLLDSLNAHPGRNILDRGGKLIRQPCRPTDEMAYTLCTRGMATRIGTHSKPSFALLYRHVTYLDKDLNERYLQAHSPVLRRELATAAFANLMLFLGWLRSGETFTLRWSDLSIVEPCEGPTVDLPQGIGALLVTLLPETKSNRSVRADVVIAYKTLGGLQPGKWFHRCRRASGLEDDWKKDNRYIFRHADGSPWSSLYYRRTYLYPSLHEQRGMGDPYLKPFDGRPGNSIEDKFWSLHTYRRAGRTHVTKPLTAKKATKDQIYEHARWKRHSQGEDIDILYRQWSILDRIQITLYSM